MGNREIVSADKDHVSSWSFRLLMLGSAAFKENKSEDIERTVCAV
jgi:hypothetical protein